MDENNELKNIEKKAKRILNYDIEDENFEEKTEDLIILFENEIDKAFKKVYNNNLYELEIDEKPRLVKIEKKKNNEYFEFNFAITIKNPRNNWTWSSNIEFYIMKNFDCYMNKKARYKDEKKWSFMIKSDKSYGFYSDNIFINKDRVKIWENFFKYLRIYKIYKNHIVFKFLHVLDSEYLVPFENFYFCKHDNPVKEEPTASNRLVWILDKLFYKDVVKWHEDYRHPRKN